MKRVLSMVLSLLMIVSIIPLGTMNASAASLDSRVEAAIQWAISIANDNSHGYSQSNRNGPDYDCSSFVSTAFKNGGFAVSGSLYTGNMLNAFVSAGFTKYNKGAVTLQRGDILLRPKTSSRGGHTELYIGNNQCVAAHSNHDGKTGDSGGKEIDVRSKNYCTFCKNSDYTYVLRYEGSSNYDNYTYSFSFNANGGTLGSSGAFSVSYGDQFQVLNTTCTRSGYTWAGWNVKRNNDNKWYVDGQGWCTESQISSNGYIKKTYPNYKTLTLDESWTSGITGNCSYTFYAIWIQSRVDTLKVFLSPYGEGYDHITALNNLSSSGFAQDQIYAWYILYDGNTGELINTYSDKTYSVELAVHDPNGELVFNYTYTDSSDANWIGVTPQMSGTYTATATISGAYSGSISTTYEVSYDTELSSSHDSISLNLNGTNNVTPTVYISGSHPGEYGVRYQLGDSSIASATWTGNWNGNSTTITVTGKKYGSTNLTISVYENYTGNKNVVASIVIPIYVSANSYTISYNANGGIGAPSSQTKYYGTDITLSSTVPTRSGYSFLGWSTSSTATSATYQPGSTFNSNANTTLYAVWKANATYSITYNANGGSGAPSTQTGSTNYAISSTVPTRFGYTFLGWSTSSSATTSTYEAGDTIAISGNLTLYAVWKSATTLSVRSSYSAKIDFANQEVYYAFTPASSGTYTFESTGSVDSKIYVYNASGTELDNDDDSSDEGTNFKLTMNLTGGTKYYIKVRAYSSYTGTISFSATGKYTVTYNANGGSGAPANQTKTHGTTLTLSTAAPSRSGYTFKGWATSSTATSATYQPGGTYSSNANITLYAVWEGGQYTISYNANGGSGAPSSQAKTYGQSLTLSTTTPTRPGYKFKGWATSSTATTASYQAGASFTTNADVTLYAVWEYKEYPVWFYANLGTGAPEHQVKLHDQPLVLPDTIPTRSGYAFLGWSTDTDATSAMYQPGGTYSANSSISLYAVWQKKTVSAISISNPPTKTVYYVGDDLNTSGLKIKVTYTDGTYEDITSGNGLGMSYNMTIVGTRAVNVKFEGKSTTFNITIKAPTISLSETTKTVVVDDTATITATTDPAGQTITWSSSNTNVATVVNGVVTAKGEGTATITAKFTYNGKEYSETCNVTVAADTYTVSYNANGGGGAPSNQTKTHGVSLTLSSTVPTRTGYTFLGWSTSSTATSATYQPGSSFTSNANTTLYAVWKANTYTISYNANGGSGTMSNSSHTYDVSKALSANVYTRSGYTFIGWATSSSATTAAYTNGQSVKNLTSTNNTTVVLYAVWEQGCGNGTHSYSYTATKAPTTSATGTLTGTCSKCSRTTTVTLPKLSTTDYSYSVRTAATCTVLGSGRYTWKTTTYGSFYFDVSISATGHTYTDKVTAPTCTVQGYTTHTCSCGYNYKDNYTDATGHNYSNGSCTYCGAEEPISSYDAYVHTEAKKTVVQGSHFTYTVSLAGTYDGFSFEIASGNGMTVTDITTTNSNINIDKIGDKWMVSVLGGLAKTDAEKEELVTVTVQVASDAELGARILTLSNLMLSNESGDKVSAIKYEYASIEITDQIPGDINGDGTFDYYDVSKLYAYYRNKTTLSESVDTDVNGDGGFDYYDVSKLYAIYRGKANFN